MYTCMYVCDTRAAAEDKVPSWYVNRENTHLIITQKPILKDSNSQERYICVYFVMCTDWVTDTVQSDLLLP